MDRFHWWNVDELEDLLAMIVREGAAHLILKFDPKTEMFQLIDKRTGDVCGTYNETHTCPPDCF